MTGVRRSRRTSPPAPLPEELDAADRELLERLSRLPRDVGWLLFGVGAAGFVAPAIFGLPFMVAGALVLWPGSERRWQALLGGNSSRGVRGGLQQIARFLDDLDSRYPSVPPASAGAKRPADRADVDSQVSSHHQR